MRVKNEIIVLISKNPLSENQKHWTQCIDGGGIL